MLYRIEEFCDEVSSNLNGMIDHLCFHTGRNTPAERLAWQRSLPKMSAVLAKRQLRDVQLYIPPRGNLLVEYRLPSSSSWCDMVLLGKNKKSNSVLIIELKDWNTKDDKQGPRENLILHKNQPYLHPSDQVRGYVNYCQRFHSAVMDYHANVSGCVYFTQDTDVSVYSMEPHDKLTAIFPVFGNNDSDESFSRYIIDRINQPDQSFANEFIKGTYKQDRNLILQVAKQFKSNESPFELLDQQRTVYEIAIKAIDESLSNNNKKKHVIIIDGPPGSGKSALAANLWSEAARKYRNLGNIVFTTTSSSQKKNWQSLFSVFGGNMAANGIVVPANLYQPGLSPKWVKNQRDNKVSIEIESWRKNIEIFVNENGTRMPDNQMLLSIVDEAHALIDPSRPETRGIPPSGCSVHAGPQAWHIIRGCKVSLFLLDGDQSFRDNETTRIEDIRNYAKDFDADIHEISLGDSQFRCGGSVEYIKWVENLLGMSSDKATVNWRKTPKNKEGQFKFKIVNTPDDLDDFLKLKHNARNSVRLAASYSKEWVTMNHPRPHTLSPKKMDFYFKYIEGGEVKEWSRIWNFAPKQNYTLFIQAPPASKMHEDPLCEVGCPYVIRGFDYDYLGILWLKDLVIRNGEWQVKIDHIHEKSIPKTIAAAKKTKDFTELSNRIKRAYRILLTRAFKGVYLWIEDRETRDYISSKLGD